MSSMDELLDVMRRLRDPASGCAWDIEQTFDSIAPYTIEEAYEVVDAIERKDRVDLRDELGDLLLQVVFHAQIASEENAFDFDDVATSIVNKMKRRHPHVFGDTSVSSTEELNQRWEAEKARERQKKQAASVGSATTLASELDGVAKNLPALKRADKLQRRAARVGFDWPDQSPVWDKLEEESAEFKSAVKTGQQNDIEDELGDMLFTLVNLARHHKVDPETALRRANGKFEARFRVVEKLASERSMTMQETDLATLDALWDEAKGELKS